MPNILISTPNSYPMLVMLYMCVGIEHDVTPHKLCDVLYAQHVKVHILHSQAVWLQTNFKLQTRPV